MSPGDGRRITLTLDIFQIQNIYASAFRRPTKVPDMTLRPPALHIPAARRLEVVDSHTCGQPTRVVIAGAGLTPGMDPCAARDALRDNADWVRRTAVMEPRAHRSMFGVAMIPPAHAGELFGAV